MAGLAGCFIFWIQCCLAPASFNTLIPQEVLHIDGGAKVLAALEIVGHFGNPIWPSRGIWVDDNLGTYVLDSDLDSCSTFCQKNPK